MKTLICLVLCALVAATYAAPVRSNMNQAEAQFWGSLLKRALKLSPHIIRGISGGVEVQDDDGDENDDDLVNIEALLSQSASQQDRAEIEGFFKLLKKIGKGALKVGPHVIRALGHGAEGALNLLPHVIGGAEVQDDDGDENDDDLVNIEALLSQSASLQDRAEIEGFFKLLKKIGKKALKVGPHVIRALGHGAEGALNLLPHVIGGAEEQDDDDNTDIQEAQISALLQNLQLHDRARMENFWKTLRGIGKGILSVFGKKK